MRAKWLATWVNEGVGASQGEGSRFTMIPCHSSKHRQDTRNHFLVQGKIGRLGKSRALCCRSAAHVNQSCSMQTTQFPSHLPVSSHKGKTVAMDDFT